MKNLITLLLALLPNAALAYGSRVNVLNSDGYTCQLRNARGAVIEAQLQRTF